MSEVTDSLNAGEVVEAMGQAWTLAHVGPAHRAEFSKQAKARAYRELFALKGLLDPGSFREALSNLQADIDAGAYNWGSPLDENAFGEAVHRLVNGPDGQVLLLSILLEKAHGKVEAAQAAALLKDNPEGVDRALRACMDLPPLSQAPPKRTQAAGQDGKGAGALATST